jgi:hypothetical protein
MYGKSNLDLFEGSTCDTINISSALNRTKGTDILQRQMRDMVFWPFKPIYDGDLGILKRFCCENMSAF